MANPFMYAVISRLEANSGLISNPEVLHILQQRSSQRASLGESLPVEQKVSPGLFYFSGHCGVSTADGIVLHPSCWKAFPCCAGLQLSSRQVSQKSL